MIQAKLARKDDPLAFVSDPAPVINCRNGEVWLDAAGVPELRPHRAESYLQHLLDVTYDPNAKCPTYDRAVLEIFAKAGDPGALRRHWNELVGYVLLAGRIIPLIVILLGRGDNGKTALVQLLVKLLGEAQVVSQRIEDLEKNRFAIGSLHRKLLFVDDDVKAGARLPDGTLKMISEAKVVSGELKYKSSFNFVVRTVPLLLCNNVPSLADVSHGMMRRLMVIPFNRTFTDADKDPEIFKRICAEELSGVLNRALNGYARLVNRSWRFKVPKDVKSTTRSWLKEANPVPAFLEEACIRKADAKCLMQSLYEAYKSWAEQAGFTMVQNRLSFKRNLEHFGFGFSKSSRGQEVTGLKLSR